MPAKILIVYDEDGKVVNCFANGDAEFYVKQLGNPPVVLILPTSVVTTEEFEKMVAPRVRGRWDLPGQKDTDETKRHSKGFPKTNDG